MLDLKSMNIENEKRKRELHLGIVLNPNIKVWRYMDLPKFMALLDQKLLFFSRADLFLDPLEGSFTKPSIEYREKVWRESMRSIPDESFQRFLEFHKHINEEQRTNFYINCWHMNDQESVAMWELYGTKNQSIAIQSKYCTLRECLPSNQNEAGAPLENHVDIGLVQYLDYSTDPMPQLYSFDPFLRKRKSFSHEQEIRLFYQAPSKEGSYTKINGNFEFIPKDKEDTQKTTGKCFNIELNKLIENIYLSPVCPPWYLELIKSICKKYGIDKPVSQSNINCEPLY